MYVSSLNISTSQPQGCCNVYMFSKKCLVDCNNYFLLVKYEGDTKGYSATQRDL